MMHWKKLGPIFCPADSHPWMLSHAANPLPYRLEGSYYRIFFNCRDARNRSHVGWVVIDLNRPDRILEIASTPALGPGGVGAFDDSGSSLGCIVTHEGRSRLYYVGWNLGVTMPWRNAIGLAWLDESAGQPRFERHAEGPIIDRCTFDPFNISYPWVLFDGAKWRMWYGTNLAATPMDRLSIPHAIKYAESADGVTWHRANRICVGGALDGDCAFSKPCVLRDPDCYRMWYCHRGEVYQLGYAESDDGLNWLRRDDLVGINSSDSGWDAESLSYPCVFDHDEQRFMLYNGQRYGATGFGLAVLETT